jgi:hypothetical protein
MKCPLTARRSIPKLVLHGEFVITPRLASGTNRDNDAAKRSDQDGIGGRLTRPFSECGCWAFGSPKNISPPMLTN